MNHFPLLALTIAGTVAHANEPIRLEDFTDRPLRNVHVEALRWQTGVWRAGGESGGSKAASWQTVGCPLGGTQLGMQQDIRDGDTRFFEFQRFADVAGGVVFFAQPGGREATPFVLVELGDGQATFENQRHDYPQRIVLHAEDDELTVTIHGGSGDDARSSQWRWQRLRGAADFACPENEAPEEAAD